MRERVIPDLVPLFGRPEEPHVCVLRGIEADHEECDPEPEAVQQFEHDGQEGRQV